MSNKCSMQLLVNLLLLALSIGDSWQQLTTEADLDFEEPGFSIGPRIVGGRRARAGQFKHQVSLRHRGQHTCGGSIISRNYVLTAAHCVQFGSNVVPANQLAIQAGSLNLNSHETYVDVANVKVHPRYNGGGVGYDVAVLRLKSNLNFNANMGSIELARNDPPTNSSVFISGWGAIYHGGPISRELLYIQVLSISRNQCTSRYMRNLPETTMCLLHGANLGACHGDSGGPAVYNNQLVGVASFVLGGCGREAPDGYERVSYLRSWIVANAELGSA
ncbi:serine protease SP24D [Drosophila sulfurigaster albostrigata]|uniref:serine protease SP24D n=1 Tax=Drosophila sulfurigaster albostrigata TaxID=89887 RepID=UPI002D21BCC4|nr:serine protease SP24D [Drosophila sulfurigaster albostrigata]